jgi:hypothetical protein
LLNKQEINTIFLVIKSTDDCVYGNDMIQPTPVVWYLIRYDKWWCYNYYFIFFLWIFHFIIDWACTLKNWNKVNRQWNVQLALTSSRRESKLSDFLKCVLTVLYQHHHHHTDQYLFITVCSLLWNIFFLWEIVRWFMGRTLMSFRIYGIIFFFFKNILTLV